MSWGANNAYSEQTWKFLAHLHGIGYPVSQIAKFANVHPNTVKYHFAKLGREGYTSSLPPIEEFRSRFNALCDLSGLDICKSEKV